MKRLKRYILVSCIMLLSVLSISAASIRLQVSPYPGRSSISVGDKFYVIIKMNNVNGKLSQINVPGASTSYFGSSSTSVVSTGSQMHATSEYTMVCRAQEKGTFTLGPITVAGVKSNAVKYTIGGKGTSSSAPQRPASPTLGGGTSGDPKYIGKGDGNLFIRASVSKTTAFEQEALVYTVKLYSSYSRIKFVGATASPKFEGFVVEESKQTDSQMRFETYLGRQYATAVIGRYIIFPQMTGTLKVTGNTYTVSVDEREYFRDEYYGNLTVSRPIQLNVSPNDLSITVRALPEPKPADFSGGVGKFTISSSIPTTHFKTGETASIVYNVTGTGNLKYVNLPDLNMLYPKQIEVYSPQTDVKATVGATSVGGTVKFDYSLMPDEEGEYKIPDVKLVYFNPETGRYEESVAKGYNITVTKGSASSKSQKKNRVVFDSQLMKVSAGNPDTPFVYRFSYWLLYIILVIVLAVAIFSYRKYLKNNADIVSVMSRKANKMAQRRLRKAAVCMQRNDIEHFYDEMLFALWGYISSKMKISTSELTRDNIAGILTEAGVAQPTIDTFITLLDDCEFAKYSPSSGADSMSRIYQNGVDVINSLEESFKKAKK